MPTVDTSLFRLSPRHGGRGCPTAHEVWILEAMSLISQCLHKRGVIAQLMVDDLQWACVHRGCLSLYQLQRFLRLVPTRGLKSWVEKLMSKLDSLGLDVGADLWDVPANPPLLISEALWQHYCATGEPDLREEVPSILSGGLVTVGELAQHGIWYAAQLSIGKGQWLPRSSLPATLPAQQYHALLQVLGGRPQRERIDQDRALLTRGSPSAIDALVGCGAGPLQTWPNGEALSQSHLRFNREDPPRNHPWQSDARLPDNVLFDLTSDTPQYPVAPEGWNLLQRNGRLLICSPAGRVGQLEAAQAYMLLRLSAVSADVSYAAILVACGEQQRQDEVKSIHWSRHLLASMAAVTKARGIIGCRSVTYHPHFAWYHSPSASDTALGSVHIWPDDPCILILDAFPTAEREALLRRATGHTKHVWVLRMAERNESSSTDHSRLVRCGAQLYAHLPKGSLTVHNSACWSEARFDALPAKTPAEIWRLGRANVEELFLSRRAFQDSLGEWKHRREDFHWPGPGHPESWTHYRAGQQDSERESWAGVVAAVDGSVIRTREKMGAGVTVGGNPVPDLNLSFPVGGPLSSLRPEAAAVHEVVSIVPDDSPLLIFIDCLVLLVILARWGQEDFWPDPEDIKHFDIIVPCIQLLRKRTAVTKFVKVKSHSGILLNERADDLAGQGCESEESPRWPGPCKLDPLRLAARAYVREAYPPFPDQNVADKTLIRRAAEGVEWATATLRGSHFAQSMLRDPVNCKTILTAINSQPATTVRVWMQAVTDTYPTMSSLHKWKSKVHRSPNCPWCSAHVPETLAHFTTVCDAFHHARTAAHNQVWQVVTSALKRALPPEWELFIETNVRDTGLLRGPSEHQPGAVTTQPAQVLARLGNLRPDAVAVNRTTRQIAILDLTRPFDGPDGPESSQQSAARPARNPHGAQAGGLVDGDAPLSAPALAIPAEYSGRRSILVAAERKVTAYEGLAHALMQLNSQAGWRVEVLPWVVGVRGVLDVAGITRAADFLGVPTQKRQGLLRATAVASVEALEYLHQVRKSANPQRAPVGPGLHFSVDRGKKRKRGEAAENTWSRWQRLARDPMRLRLKRARWRGTCSSGSGSLVS